MIKFRNGKSRSGTRFYECSLFNFLRFLFQIRFGSNWFFTISLFVGVVEFAFTLHQWDFDALSKS